MAILIAKASSGGSPVYTFGSTNETAGTDIFYGIKTVATPTLNFTSSAASLVVAAVIDGETVNLTTIKPAGAATVALSGNEVVLTNSSKTYKLEAWNAAETVTVNFGSGGKLSIARDGSGVFSYTETVYTNTGAAGTNVTKNSGNTLDFAIPVTPVITQTRHTSTTVTADTAALQGSYATAYPTSDANWGIYFVNSSLAQPTTVGALVTAVSTPTTALEVSTTAYSSATVTMGDLVDGTYNAYAVDKYGDLSAAGTTVITQFSDIAAVASANASAAAVSSTAATAAQTSANATLTIINTGNSAYTTLVTTDTGHVTTYASDASTAATAAATAATSAAGASTMSTATGYATTANTEAGNAATAATAAQTDATNLNADLAVLIAHGVPGLAPAPINASLNDYASNGTLASVPSYINGNQGNSFGSPISFTANSHDAFIIDTGITGGITDSVTAASVVDTLTSLSAANITIAGFGTTNDLIFHVGSTFADSTDNLLALDALYSMRFTRFLIR